MSALSGHSSDRKNTVEDTAGRHKIHVCVVGSGTRFLSGISYYTHRLATALTERHDVSLILMRQLLPTRFYPGRGRVSARLARLKLPESVAVFDGIDWFWLPSIFRASVFLLRRRPQVIIFQWWTGTVLHSYLALALLGRLASARVVIEFHEAQDTGEAHIPLAAAYVHAGVPWLMRLADGMVVHSGFDQATLAERYPLAGRPVAVISHGPYDQYQQLELPPPDEPGPLVSAGAANNESDVSPIRLLYFGVIRPFKGVEDLIRAFDELPAEEAAAYTLMIVGETWEGWTLPARLIAQSRYRDRITFVNRYVSDEEVSAVFAEADAVVLPYHRSSASGPLHVAMSHGLPVIVSRVGGLVEAAANYAGAIFVPPHNPDAIRAALPQLASLRGRRFADPHSWDQSVTRFDTLFETLHVGAPRRARAHPVASIATGLTSPADVATPIEEMPLRGKGR